MLTKLLHRAIALLFFWKDYKLGRPTYRTNKQKFPVCACSARSPIGREADAYWRIPLASRQFGRCVLLLTDHELQVGFQRARAQAEDCKLPGSLVEEAFWPLP